MKVEHLFEENYFDYVKRLTKSLNIKELGYGAYSRVFQHPVYTNVAVKLYMDDPDYGKYIKFAKKHPDNPWLPKIIGTAPARFDTGPYKRDPAKGTFVFMQLLKPSTQQQRREAVRQVIDSVPAKDRPHRFAFVKEFKHLERSDWQVISVCSKDKHIRELASILYDLNARDTFPPNIMQRDGQIVFSDPVASVL